MGRRDTILSSMGMAFAAFVLAHDLAFLVAYGTSMGAALARTGHGISWLVCLATAVGIAVLLILLAARRLLTLRALATRLKRGEVEVRSGRWQDLVRHAVMLWLVIFAVALACFVVSENLEHAAAGLPLPGLGVLMGSPGYSPAIPMLFAGVALLVGAIGALYRWRRDLLEERLHQVLAGGARPLHVALPRPAIRDRRPILVLGGHGAGRSPPGLPAARGCAH